MHNVYVYALYVTDKVYIEVYLQHTLHYRTLKIGNTNVSI